MCVSPKMNRIATLPADVGYAALKNLIQYGVAGSLRVNHVTLAPDSALPSYPQLRTSQCPSASLKSTKSDIDSITDPSVQVAGIVN
jgi:hypothetical protein